MSVCLILVLIVLLLILVIKIIVMKNELKNIGGELSRIMKTDTNNLITLNTKDKDLRKFVNLLNKNLKELRNLELEYKNGNGELKTSITNISHDLRTPLTAIRGYLDLIENENLPKKQAKYLEIIDRKVKDLTDLTEQLFDFSKVLDVQNDIKKDNIVINNVLEETLISFYGLFKEYKITPKIDICEEKVTRLLNETMLKRIFENIISNAIKYSEKDFNVKLLKDGTIEFSNKTAKIDNVNIEKIFDRYYTVKSSRKATGIGLSIAKQLTALSGGEIKATYQNNILKISLKF